jgi:hypothetical protein
MMPTSRLLSLEYAYLYGKDIEESSLQLSFSPNIYLEELRKKISNQGK